MKQARLTDGDWTASTAESHSASAQSDENNTSGGSRPATKATLCERAATHASKIAAEHFPELPVEAIDWETSTRMQRSAGVAMTIRVSRSRSVSRGMP